MRWDDTLDENNDDMGERINQTKKNKKSYRIDIQTVKIGGTATKRSVI